MIRMEEAIERNKKTYVELSKSNRIYEQQRTLYLHLSIESDQTIITQTQTKWENQFESTKRVTRWWIKLEEVNYQF